MPRSYFIDKDGMAHTFNLVLPALNSTIDWIDMKKYKNSGFRFKAPPILSEYKIYWAYLKKEARLFYIIHALDKVEEILRKTKISYVVDLDPMDFNESRPYQKMDRQILLFISLIGMALEHVWDMYWAASTPAEKKKKKSFLDSSASADEIKPEGQENPKKDKNEKKSEREKLD